MGDPVLNCLLDVCCEAMSAKQHETMTRFLMGETGCDEKTAQVLGGCILKHFDLAEKGTLAPFKASIARLARG